MKVLKFYIPLLKQEILKFRRSSYWKKDLFTNTATFILYSINILTLFFLGKNTGKIITKLEPGINVVHFVNRYLLVSLLFIYLLRFFFQDSKTLTIKPYLTLPYQKSFLIKLLLLRSSFNIYVFSIIIFSVPFCFANIIPSHSLLPGLLWLAGLILIIFSLEMLFMLFQYLFYVSPYKTIISLSTFIVTGFISIKVNLFPGLKTNILEGLLFSGTVVLPALFIFTIITFYSTCRFLLTNLVVDKQEAKTGNIFWKFNFDFLAKKDPLLFLQIKLIARNKLLRNFLFQGLMGPLIGIIFSLAVPAENINKHFMLTVFLAFFSIGYFFVAAYGQNIFGWESHYLNAYFTKNISVEKYISSKIKFIQMAWIFFALTNLCIYKLLNTNFLALVLTMQFYCIGVLTFTLAAQAALNFRSIYPNVSFGFGLVNFRPKKSILMLTAFYPLIIIFLITGGDISKSQNYFLGLGIIVITGIAGLLFQKQISRLINKLFVKKRYFFIEESLRHDSY